MDKIMSTRLDESVISSIRVLAHDLGMSKKAVIEAAINLFADKAKSNINIDAFERSFGAWERDESAGNTIKTVKVEFEKSIKRHHK